MEQGRQDNQLKGAITLGCTSITIENTLTSMVRFFMIQVSILLFHVIHLIEVLEADFQTLAVLFCHLIIRVLTLSQAYWISLLVLYTFKGCALCRGCSGQTSRSEAWLRQVVAWRLSELPGNSRIWRHGQTEDRPLTPRAVFLMTYWSE